MCCFTSIVQYHTFFSILFKTIIISPQRLRGERYLYATRKSSVRITAAYNLRVLLLRSGRRGCNPANEKSRLISASFVVFYYCLSSTSLLVSYFLKSVRVTAVLLLLCRGKHTKKNQKQQIYEGRGERSALLSHFIRIFYGLGTLQTAPNRHQTTAKKNKIKS